MSLNISCWRLSLIAAAGLLLAPHRDALGCDPATATLVCPTPIYGAAPVATLSPVLAAPIVAGPGVVYAPATVAALPVVAAPPVVALAFQPAQPFAYPQPLVQPLRSPHRAAVVAPSGDARVTIERRGLFRRERITVQ